MKHLLFFTLIFAVSLTSCGDNTIVKPTKDKTLDWTKDDKSGDKAPCFSIVYPVTLLLPDDAGTEVIVGSKEEWHDVLVDWKKAHPDAAQYPELQYPVDVEIYNGDIRTVANAEEFARLKKKCEDWVGESDRACFVYLFPVVVMLPNDAGTQIEVNSKEEWYQVLADWKSDHPDSDQLPELQYPIEVKLQNGKILTIESAEVLLKLKERCKDGVSDKDKQPCFWLIYPVTLTLGDGSSVEVADAKEWHEVAAAWKHDHPDSAIPPQLDYPVEIKLRNGDIREVLSKEDMAVLKEKCKDRIGRDTQRDYSPGDTGK